MPDGYEEKRFITVTKQKKDQGKLRRFVVNPIRRIMNWTAPDKKKDRLTA